MNKKTLIILTCLCIVIAAMDVSGLPYCFTQNMRYETISMVLLTAVYVALFTYCAVAWFSRCSKQGISNQSNA